VVTGLPATPGAESVGRRNPGGRVRLGFETRSGVGIDRSEMWTEERGSRGAPGVSAA